MIGFDLFYNTSYYANAYMPSLAVFYQQQEKQLGNYPYFDVFLNIRLKRVRFFLKYEHLNSGWIEKNFFTALHYPKNQAILKIWYFMDFLRLELLIKIKGTFATNTIIFL